MGFLDFLDAITDDNTYFNVECTTLEIFEIGTTWKGTARVHGAGNHIETKKVSYQTRVAMPSEDSGNYTRRGWLRKDLRKWAGKTFGTGSELPRESIVLNTTENCLSCEGYAKKVGDTYVLTTKESEAQYYLAYKLNIYKDGNQLGHEDLDYYFKADTQGYVTNVSVKDGW